MSTYVDGKKVEEGILGATIELDELEPLVKGSIVIGDGIGPPSSHPIGADGRILVADSSDPHGVKWSPDIW